MTVKLNRKALDHARSLVDNGTVVHDERDDWSEDAPNADAENAFIEKQYTHDDIARAAKKLLEQIDD